MSFFSNKFAQRAAATVATVASVVTFGLAALPSNAFGGDKYEIKGRIHWNRDGSVTHEGRTSSPNHRERTRTDIYSIPGAGVVIDKEQRRREYDSETGVVYRERSYSQEVRTPHGNSYQQQSIQIIRPYSAGPSGLCSPGYYGVDLFDGYGAVVDTVCCPNDAGLVRGQNGYECHLQR